MLTGFNTDIKVRGIVYHVQTEDKGVKNPKVETLVYKRGTIIHAKRTSYAEVVSMDCFEDVVRKLMEEQHRRIIKEVRAGKFEEHHEEPSKADKNKSLVELIMDFMVTDSPERKH